MHPVLLQQIARQRYEELRSSARQRRAPLVRRRGRSSVRYRAGWALVEIGLAVAGSSADAGQGS